jgi:hypothetical protein
MQTLDFTQITAPEGFFVSDVKLTKAGIAKLEAFIDEFYDFDNWGQYAVADAAFDVQCDAINTESEPMFMIRAERSLTEKTEVLRFVRDRDYTVEMTSFEADKLAKLARNLNDLHNTMQEEMSRLGW